ncbi:hypothetical protein AAFS18_08330 [Lactobacillus crispatus]
MIDLHYFAFDEPLHHLMNTSIKYSDFETAKEHFDKYFSFLEEVRDKVFSKSETEVLKKPLKVVQEWKKDTVTRCSLKK